MDREEKATPVLPPEANPTSSARDYWMKRLATLPLGPELPVFLNQAGITGSKATRRQFRLDEKAWKGLQGRAAQIGCSSLDVLVAAFAEVLAIWSKSPHFTLNLSLCNEGDEDSLINLLEVDNSKAESFETRLRHLREQLRSDLAHSSFSGLRVMEELAREHGMPAGTFMPVFFTSFLRDGSGQHVAQHVPEQTAKAAAEQRIYLYITVREDRGTLYITSDAADEMFPPELLDDMFGAYQTLLGQLSRDQVAWGRTLADNTRKLLPAKQARLFEEVNRTQASASDEFLHTLFLKQVEERPDQLAICTPTRRMTYAELYTRACRVEEELLPRGLEPNQFAGIVMEPGWEQIVAAMGILFAGGAYMPIDPDLPPERQRYLIENGDVKVVLTQSSIQHRLNAPRDVEILLVDELLPLEGRPTTAPRTRQKREDLAYNIYTSGSTGQPKGVIVDHCAAVNTILDINERFGVGPEDRVLALSRLSFDLSVYDIFGLLAAGGTVVIPSPARAQDPAHWAELIVSEKVTVWDTVPALTDLLVEQAEHGTAIGQSLRLILMSGDWIPLGLPGRIKKLLPKAQVVSLGGATEAAIWSILYPIDEVDAKWKSIPYGKPMRNQGFHVLNYGEAPCPVWVPGELYIGGAGLARGYWRDAQKTAASFIYHKSTGERLYRTGDWGRYLPDGNIEFLGREDFQVKLKGNRIELGEIEAKLMEHESVDVCVVLAREDTPGERGLVAYVIPRSGKPVTASDLREFLTAKLADYMVPSAFVFMEQLPLTTNGKVNRRALPAP